MNSQLKVKRAYGILVREVEQYIRLFGGFDLDLYRLAPESFYDFNNLVMMVELTRDIIEYIHLNYTRNWNHYGYNFWQHADAMEKQLEILTPIVINMLDDEELDIDEILRQMKTPKILPDGIAVSYTHLTLPTTPYV